MIESSFPKENYFLIKEFINTSSIQESNLFLELLWDKLDVDGWAFFPMTDTNKKFVSIGDNKIGHFSYSYKKRGTIEYLFIFINKQKKINLKEIRNIIHECKNSLNILPTKYWIKAEFLNNSQYILRNCTYNNISITTENNKNFIIFEINSITRKGLQHKVPNILTYICNLLLEYTNVCFYFNRNFSYSDKKYSIDSSSFLFENYDYDWFDIDELLKIHKNFILPKDFFIIIDILINSDSPYFVDNNIKLLLNSAQILFTAKSLENLYLENSKYLFSTILDDLLDSTVVSSLEPLSIIKDPRVERCTSCNNLKYSISSKVKKLVEYYLPENKILLRYISQKYDERSKLLHEGQSKVYEYKFGNSFPQINYIDKKTIILPHSLNDTFLLELSSFIFRNIAHDLFK